MAGGVVEAPFGDGLHRFRLEYGHLQELEEKCDRGAIVVAQRLATSEYRVAEVRETLRLGLVGGGMDPVKAVTLVDRYLKLSIDPHRILAFNVLSVAMFGDPEDAPGKSGPEAAQSQAAPGETDAPASGPSSPPGP